MKKVLLFGLGVIASISVLTSCKKDELAAPTVSFQNAKTTYVAESVNDTVYETTITIDAPAKLETIKVFKVTDSGKTTERIITDFTSSTQHVFQYKFRAGKYEIEATDKDNQTSSAYFTFTAYTAPAGEIVSYATKIMGAQYNNGVGSFLSTSNGTVYGKADAKTNATLVDFVYSYRGGNYLAFLAAPSDALLDATLNIKAENWSTYNSTKFKLSALTTTEFDAITDDSKFSAVTGLTETNVLNLQVGNVVYFKTAAGKLGVFKVKAINEGTNGGDAVQKYQDGSIEIDVKVQK
jgi:hypothetical protein